MTDNKYFVFRFDDVELRDREFVLTKASEVLPVEPKAFRVLQYLLRNPHKLVTKDELLDAVWGDVSVSENSVARAVAQLRRLLGDDLHEPRYIATVPTVGYRLVCKVEVLEEASGNGKLTDSANVPGIIASVKPDSGLERAEVQGKPQAYSAHTATPPEVNASTKTATETKIRSRRVWITLTVLTACVLLAGLGLYFVKPPAPKMEAVRFAPPGIDVNTPMWSPDGKAIVYVAKPREDTRDQLFLRYLDSPVGIQLTHLPDDWTAILFHWGGRMTGPTSFSRNNRTCLARMFFTPIQFPR